jgi:kinetochore protein Mis13/DSN1
MHGIPSSKKLKTSSQTTVAEEPSGRPKPKNTSTSLPIEDGVTERKSLLTTMIEKYDEEVDDFVFKRKKSTKTKTTRTSTEGPRRQSARLRSRQSIEGEIATSQVTTLKSRTEETRVSRPAKHKSVPERANTIDDDRESHPQLDERERAVTPPAPQLEQNDEVTKIHLPMSDTPILRKNKELRHGKGKRRSSMGMRGRRASSLIDNGHLGMLRLIARGLLLRKSNALLLPN